MDVHWLVCLCSPPQQCQPGRGGSRALQARTHRVAVGAGMVGLAHHAWATGWPRAHMHAHGCLTCVCVTVARQTRVCGSVGVWFGKLQQQRLARMLSLWALVSIGFYLGSVGRHSCDMMNFEWLAEIIFRGMCTVVFDFLFSAVLQLQKQRAAGRAGTGQRLCLLLCYKPLDQHARWLCHGCPTQFSACVASSFSFSLLLSTQQWELRETMQPCHVCAFWNS